MIIYMTPVVGTLLFGLCLLTGIIVLTIEEPHQRIGVYPRSFEPDAKNHGRAQRHWDTARSSTARASTAIPPLPTLIPFTNSTNSTGFNATLGQHLPLERRLPARSKGHVQHREKGHKISKTTNSTHFLAPIEVITDLQYVSNTLLSVFEDMDLLEAYLRDSPRLDDTDFIAVSKNVVEYVDSLQFSDLLAITYLQWTIQDLETYIVPGPYPYANTSSSRVKKNNKFPGQASKTTGVQYFVLPTNVIGGFERLENIFEAGAEELNNIGEALRHHVTSSSSSAFIAAPTSFVSEVDAVEDRLSLGVELLDAMEDLFEKQATISPTPPIEDSSLLSSTLSPSTTSTSHSGPSIMTVTTTVASSDSSFTTKNESSSKSFTSTKTITKTTASSKKSSTHHQKEKSEDHQKEKSEHLHPRNLGRSLRRLPDQLFPHENKQQKVLSARNASAEVQQCGTKAPSKAFRQHAREYNRHYQEPDPTLSDPLIIDVYMHVVADSEENYLSEEMLEFQRNVITDAFKAYAISFSFVNTSFTADEHWANGRIDGAAREMKASLHRGTYADLNLYFSSGAYRHYLGPRQGLFGYCDIPGLPEEESDCDSDECVELQDGCVIAYETLPNYLPLLDRKGITAVHEIGHWFGLLHTFHEDEKSGEDPCSPEIDDGDLIWDTPPQSVATRGCPVGQDSCPGSEGLDAIHNYMDYSSDPCLTSFTAGQAKRMHEVYKEYRSDGDPGAARRILKA